MRTRSVLLIGDAPALKPTTGGLFGNGGSVRTITHAARIMELLRGVLRTKQGQLGFDGGDRSYLCTLEGGGSGTSIEARLVDASIDDPGKNGRPVTVWFGMPSGIYGFRCAFAGGQGNRLLLELPQAVIRYSRRMAPRYVVRADDPPSLILPLDDGTGLDCRDILEISTGGLSLVLPVGMEFKVGGAARAVLRLRSENALQVVVACRHARPYDAGRVRCGIQFLDAPRVLALAIERYVQKLGLRSLEEELPRQLQPAVALPDPTAGRASRG